jgi:Salmonella virulence plasmid 65kDa B protein
MHLQRAKTLLGLAFFLFALTSRSESLADYGATPPLTKPQSDQSAASQKLNFHTDPFTGRFSYSIPIEVPPARQGTAPGIALQYSSADKNGWCGVGWDLDIGYIQRETRYGVPISAYYSDAYGFTFSVTGNSGKLINVGGSNYCPQIDTGFLKCAYSNGWWTVTSKGGTIYYFGETAASRITNGYGTFKWALSSIRDPNGNLTLLNYTSDSGQLYLKEIDYNGNTNSPAIATNCAVVFDLTNRSDTVSSVISGSEVNTQKRLGAVRVYAQGQLVRRYALQYTYSPSTGRSLLQSLTEFGSDNTTALPAHTFSYSVQSQSFQSEVSWPVTSQYPGTPTGVAPGTPYARLVDINGDGLPDWVTVPQSYPFDHFNVQLNTGNGFSSTVSTWNNVGDEGNGGEMYWSSINGADPSGHGITELVDMDGDGLPDRVMRARNSPYDHLQLQKNTGSGFNTSSPMNGVDSSANSFGVITELLRSPSGNYLDNAYGNESSAGGLVTDMNGDGLPDRVMIGSSSGQFDVQLNQGGSSFGSVRAWGNVAAAQ